MIHFDAPGKRSGKNSHTEVHLAAVARVREK
jgi:hypothetical protein